MSSNLLGSRRCVAATLPPHLRLLLATADTAIQRNDRILGVQCILLIFAEFDRAALWEAGMDTTRDAA
jgi:hypothetical protein